jgi:hypothetical protein
MPSHRTRKTPEQAVEPLHPDLAAAVAELEALGLIEPIVKNGQPGHRITPLGSTLAKEPMMRVAWPQNAAVRH